DEGGVRVPFAIWWPEHVEGGRRIDKPAQHIDLLPTLMSLVGQTPENPDQLHGLDLTPLLAEEEAGHYWPDRLLFVHHFRNTTRPHQVAVAPGPGAVRTERWLATQAHDEQWALYDLKNDPRQQHDIAGQAEATLASLSQAYGRWYRDLLATNGALEPLPIEIGHAGYEQVLFPAHEGSIVRGDIDYHNGDGWSHDWVTSQSEAAGTLTWPLKVVSPGRYRVSLGYASPDGEYLGPLSLSIMGELRSASVLAEHAVELRQGKRRYETGEAPDIEWASEDLGMLGLEPGQGEIRLTFGTDKNAHRLMVKHLLVEKVE
ncbi:MAG TPA: sulfatase/phosphatase domain-containing protein, partial [Cellvibrionaceae bacterium]